MPIVKTQRRTISRFKRHLRIRKKIFGTSERPRLSISRTLNHLSAQLIDDINHKTIFAFSTQNKEFRKNCKNGGNVEASVKLGEFFGPKIISSGIKKLAFDRNGFLYHGRVKALADSLRKSGLEF